MRAVVLEAVVQKRFWHRNIVKFLRTPFYRERLFFCSLCNWTDNLIKFSTRKLQSIWYSAYLHLLFPIDWVKLKVRLSPSRKNCFICFNEIPLKMMKSAFYFILKALSFSRYLSWLFGQVLKTAWIESWGFFLNL